MWKYLKLVIGIFLLLSCVAGVISISSGEMQKAGRRIAENGVDTVGVIDSRIEHTVAARYRRIGGIGRYYTIKYSFTTLDGRNYSDEINVSKEQAYSATEGQAINIRYYADQPSINSPLDYEEYMTSEAAEDLPVGTIIFAQALMFFGGLWMVWSAWIAIRPAPTPRSPASRYQNQARTQTASRTRPVTTAGGKPAFGRR